MIGGLQLGRSGRLLVGREERDQASRSHPLDDFRHVIEAANADTRHAHLGQGADQRASAASSFSQTPPKSPLLITTATSPGCALAATCATIASTSGSASAGTPRAPMSAASCCAEKRSVTSPVAL